MFLLFSLSQVSAARDLPLARARLGQQEIQLEVAEDTNTRTTGLMFRTSMPENRGMLFVFEKSEVLTFWMRNTRIPLSIAFLDEKLEIIKMADMQPASDLDLDPPRYSSDKPAKFALEMNLGWFAKHRVKLGDRLKILDRGRSKKL